MTTTYTFDQLKEDVRKEAEALRAHATKEEREKLDFENLDASNKHRCIYGQMTGDCFSKRSAHLINTCAISHFDMLPDSTDDLDECLGKKADDFITERTSGSLFSGFTFSAIEAYIYLPEARNENLISFLRGETETLEL